MQTQIQLLLNYAILLYNTNIINSPFAIINAILNQRCYVIVAIIIIQYPYIQAKINIRLLIIQCICKFYYIDYAKSVKGTVMKLNYKYKSITMSYQDCY